MKNKLLILIVCVIGAVTDVSGQSRSKRVKQPREVIEAYRVCSDFQRLLAENLDFDRAFEATFVKDPARRREIAIAEADHGDGDLAQVDTAIVVDIYKAQSQLLILVLPLLFVDREDAQTELLPPRFEQTIKRKPPNDPQLQAYAAQLKRDVTDFRAHVEKLATTNTAVANNIAEYRKFLLKPLVPPNRLVKPLTAYSKGSVLPVNAKYYQIEDCAMIREDGQMRLIGYTFFKMRG